MEEHPELGAEQAYIDRCYDALEEMRVAARRLGDSVRTLGAGGTFAARVERDVFVRTSAERLAQLDIGAESLVFGRTDTEDAERFYIGRIAVSGPDRHPLVVDWRAPAAEPFYRATGRHPLGLTLRRHFLCEGPKLLEISDELFGTEADPELGLVGAEALMSALGRARTGRMRDIVATIQREQDEIIREDLSGVLVAQGGPGTGKTAVALHRAAYLLFTHRYALHRDGVLVVGPNQLFLRYIEHVLPALGESGVALATAYSLVPDVKVTATETTEGARVKGDPRMATVIARALADRQRALTHDLTLEVREVAIKLTVADSARITSQVKRRRQPHNDRRQHVERLVLRRLYGRYQAAFKPPRQVDLTEDEFIQEVADEPELRRALNRMWPRLRPWELVHDLLGARALIASAADDVLDASEQSLLFRPWSDDPRRAPWTRSDLALIDEATALLGPLRRRNLPTDEIADYGHIVVDEAQDLTPMELRMVARRSRTGSMTVVGDVAQATGPWAPRSWTDLLAHLPDRGPVRVAELTVNYRTPGEIMALAARVLAAAIPGATPPTSVRETGEEPVVTEVSAADLESEVARLAEAELAVVRPGTVAVIAPTAAIEGISAALQTSAVPFARAEDRVDAAVTVVDVGSVKGLEFDSVVVVEPAAIVREAIHGMGALYVALTRTTRRLSILHTEPLPEPLVRRADQPAER